MSEQGHDNFIRECAIAEKWESIPAVFKLLYSDFIVVEIPSEAGRPLQPSLNNDLAEHSSKGDNPIEKAAVDEKCATTAASLDVDLVERIKKMAEGEEDSEKKKVKDLSKEERKRIHDYVRQNYAGKLASTGENNALIIRRIDSRQHGDDRREKRPIWPTDRPDYLHFTMTKENKDSQWVVNLLSRLCHARPQNFSMAGTKDRRAITTQRMCLYRTEKARMQKVSNTLRHGVWLSDFSYQPHRLKLGSLWGNRFHVVLREVEVAKFTDGELAQRIEKWRHTGFLNYFGSQRFGTCGVNTAEVGRLILSSQWEKAVNELLKPRKEAHGRLNEALAKFVAGDDPDAALRLLSYGGDSTRQPQFIEVSLLSSLKRDRNAFKSAILALPRDSRSLYIHAYQSLLFNRVLSMRVLKYGLATMDGDRGLGGEVLAAGGNIADAYIPLPSAATANMEGEISKWYRQFMGEDGVELEAFSALEKQFAIGDVLRPVLVKPSEVQWEIVRYHDPREPLQRSPFIPIGCSQGQNGACDAKSTTTDDIYSALKLSFDLPSGSYATIALRELLRWEMGKEAQKEHSAP